MNSVIVRRVGVGQVGVGWVGGAILQLHSRRSLPTNPSYFLLVQLRHCLLDERRQIIAVGFDQVIHQMPDLVEAEFSGGVWVHHGGVVDMLTLAG